MSNNVQFLLRNGVKTDWTSVNPVLAKGEPGCESDTGQMKVGDGQTAWRLLPYVASGELQTALPNTLITNTEWVAGGNAGGLASIALSGNGNNWKPANNVLNSGKYVYSVVWTGFNWLAGGDMSAVLKNGSAPISTSTDGNVWNQTQGQNFGLVGVCYGLAYNGKQYIAVGSDDASGVTVSTYTVALSNDGVNWERSTTDPFAGVSGGVGFGVCWDGRQWVAVGANSNPSRPGQSTSTIAVSADGNTWTNLSNDPFVGGSCYAVGYNGSQYVFAGTNGGSLFVNGATAGSYTLAVTQAGSQLYREDSFLGAPVTNDPFKSGNAYGVAWNGTKWLAVGTSVGPGVTGITSVNTAAVSKDGVNWLPTKPFNNGIGYGVAWNGNTWVLSGTDVPSGDLTTVPTVLNVFGNDGLNWNVSGPAVPPTAESVQYTVAVKNTLAGVVTPHTVSSGQDGFVQYSDGNGNFVSAPGVYIDSNTLYGDLLTSQAFTTTNFVDAHGSTGMEGEVLTVTGNVLTWNAPTGGGGGGGATFGTFTGADVIDSSGSMGTFALPGTHDLIIEGINSNSIFIINNYVPNTERPYELDFSFPSVGTCTLTITHAGGGSSNFLDYRTKFVWQVLSLGTPPSAPL
jgi:hypothetical protein